MNLDGDERFQVTWGVAYAVTNVAFADKFALSEGEKMSFKKKARSLKRPLKVDDSADGVAVEIASQSGFLGFF